MVKPPHLRVPASWQPSPVRTPHSDRDKGLPLADPWIQRHAIRLPRNTEEMQVIRHDHVRPDMPFHCPTPRLAQGVPESAVVQTMIRIRFAQANTDHKHHRVIPSFHRRWMCRLAPLGNRTGFFCCHHKYRLGKPRPPGPSSSGGRTLVSRSPAPITTQPSRQFPARQASPSKSPQGHKLTSRDLKSQSKHRYIPRS